MLNIGWFSSGRDQAAIDLLRVVYKAIEDGSIVGKISFVFVSREKGEKPESDRFINYANNLDLDVIELSHRNFEPELRRKALEESSKLGKDSPDLIEWRTMYDKVILKKLENYPVDIIVLAGYMLIVSPYLCNKYNMINLHPALPGGPKGTWQEVIWQLMEQRAEKTGVMMHLITPELDAGPPITYCQFSISDEQIQPFWDNWEEKRKKNTLKEIQMSEGENEPLFHEIRRRGLLREFPVIVATLKSASYGEFKIINGEVVSNNEKLEHGFDLTEEVENSIQK